ncbi:MAG: hypothetical protein GXP14_08550 [Gammaproteobacteria bacterium]|nr:hypothetical protein [Gammaproteobacteria bacterium]
MWSEKRELVKHAANLAKEKHPEGFNKQQLIDASKEVFGGYSANPSKPIKTMEDVNNMGNHMAQVDGHYPVGMSGCYVVGLNGGCGIDCPVFKEGECGEPQEFEARDVIDELGQEEAEEVMASYSCFDRYFGAD